ncbi:Transposon TX1 uncharacterized 82 kDa protein ORF 1 [Takifugu flavidus]|uniref:Transposon TX1 uncharacterized 82 kDa protein ORF 1 n=1 Tax=Takifugu flavidus TaxID=433684 RepID=A0A5C6PPF0_9TELE|nr:Transposon TX1 uncharacterized 82 kDa protein ORF 1 [Takifugu flavidus]
MVSSGTPSLSIRHRVRVQPDSSVPVEEVLLAVGDQVGHANLSYASRMNRGVVVFVKEERLVAELVGRGVTVNRAYLQVSPLAAPSTRVTVSGVPPFITNEALEQELQRFGKFGSGLRTVGLGCRNDKLKHVHSLRRQCFMFLTCPSQTLDVSFRVGGGLSCPVSVQQKTGMRQGCPISGQLYSLAIEPLLNNLRTRLSGLLLPSLPERPQLVVSAYADDINVFVRDQGDVDNLIDSLDLYQEASSAKVNWEKSEALQVGPWAGRDRPRLPGNLSWGRQGLKVLGVFLGTENFEKKNWEGAVEQVCTRLSKWKWLLPQLSYRGRVLIVNNLVASTLWHRLTVLPSPAGLIEGVQKMSVDFFWSGQHWLRSAVLYLPVQEGGQGLVDIASRVTAFRLQTAQRLLYSFGVPWTDMACLLLRKAGRLGYDKQLFLLQSQSVDLTGLTPFYQSVLKVWQVLSFKHKAVTIPGMWIFEEPLFGNNIITSRVLSSTSLRSRLRDAGVMKPGHLLKTPVPDLSDRLNMRSSRLLLQLVREVCASLPEALRVFVLDPSVSELWDDNCEYVFPSLAVCPAVGQWQPEEDDLLSLKSSVSVDFEGVGRKDLYILAVKPGLSGWLASNAMVFGGGSRDLSRLKRRHGVKVGTGSLYTVEEVALAVGEKIGHGSVKSAARMHGAVVLFVDKVEQANRLVETGISVGVRFEAVLPLTQPSTRITLSNVPPFISDEFLARELARFGKIVSPIKKVLSGCKSPLLKHVMSHRRHDVLYMILNNRAEELNVRFHVKVEEFDYMLYASSSALKCFGCGEEGHLVRACPGRAGSVPVGFEGRETAPAWPGAGTGSVPVGPGGRGPAPDRPGPVLGVRADPAGPLRQDQRRVLGEVDRRRQVSEGGEGQVGEGGEGQVGEGGKGQVGEGGEGQVDEGGEGQRKKDFTCLRQWWDHGKVQIRLLCQQRTLNVTRYITRSIEALKTEIVELEQLCESRGDRGCLEALKTKKMALANLLDTKVQGALVRSRIQDIAEMDTPSTFFFGLERKSSTPYYRRKDGS